MNKKLNQDLEFLIEIDKMKNVYRAIKICSQDRLENDAEHSFHVALMAMTLSSYAQEDIDLLKVLKMLLIHDLVEIDAGDTFAYDQKGYETKFEREQKAADRIYGLLNEDKEKEFRNLYDEFENMETQEAQFANFIDRFQPILLNYLNGGGTWKEHHIKKEQVEARIAPFQKTSPALYDFTCSIIDEYFDRGVR